MQPRPLLFPRRRAVICAIAACVISALLALAFVKVNADDVFVTVRSADERLTFQTASSWSPRVAIDADVAMVYGIDAGLPQRLESWRSHGYRTQVMTGVSWGNYQDYLHGRWDGKDHTDERQTDQAGQPLQHGLGGDVWYMSPGEQYGKYLTQGVKRALDAGAEAVYLEEPEFWVRGGYEASFKREWKAFYGEEWQPPHLSVDNQYRSSKLKYFLYRRALAQVFDFVRLYGKEHGGRAIPCYVPTHSLLNYAHWGIVSPESSLLNVGCDGYIAQVWTGTARTPNVYQGVEKSRTFETAFLEYGAMQNLVRASGRKVWYLNDPVEDDPNHSWTDYRNNWQSTLVASMLQPEVWRFEVMPWPDRVFEGKYPAGDGDAAHPAVRVGIPPGYATELQTVFSAMGNLRQPAAKVRWELCGTQGIGILVSDTMMFQRGEPTPSDPNLGSFYGLAMPLVERGLPIEPVQIESASASGFLDRYKVLLLTYEGQKPPTPEFHAALASWVKAGGALVIVDDDRDPYNKVREWWNTPPRAYKTPRHHLLETLGLPLDAKGLSHVGKGVVLIEPLSPAALSHDTAGGQRIAGLARQASEAVGLAWKESSALALRRGPYVIAAGLDDSAPAAGPAILHGRFISLFDADLPVVRDVKLDASRRSMLLDIDAAIADHPEGVLASACGIRDEAITATAIRFKAVGVADSDAVVCIAMPKPPVRVNIEGKPLNASSWNFADGIVWVRFHNSPAGREVSIER